MSDYVPRPGDLFLSQIGGLGGLLIRAGQGLVAGDWSIYTHAGVVLDRDEILAAQPWGARIDALSSITAARPLAFLPVPEWAEHLRPSIVELARTYEGHRYGFLSYLWIGLSRVGIRPAWLRDVVASDRWLICSALADRCWHYPGIHLFDDGRPVGEVTPGDLAHVGTVHHIGTGPYPTAA